MKHGPHLRRHGARSWYDPRRGHVAGDWRRTRTSGTRQFTPPRQRRRQ
ncbi:hypothetical protein ACLESO_59870 [Pyxidicoccus sp. 3LG]